MCVKIKSLQVLPTLSNTLIQTSIIILERSFNETWKLSHKETSVKVGSVFLVNKSIIVECLLRVVVNITGILFITVLNFIHSSLCYLYPQLVSKEWMYFNTFNLSEPARIDNIILLQKNRQQTIS